MIIFMLSTLVLVSCSSEESIPKFDGIGRGAAMTDEEKSLFIEERQQLAQDACIDKIEGDSCILKTQRGEIEGSCTNVDDTLTCFSEQQRMVDK